MELKDYLLVKNGQILEGYGLLNPDRNIPMLDSEKHSGIEECTPFMEQLQQATIYFNEGQRSVLNEVVAAVDPGDFVKNKRNYLKNLQRILNQ